MIIPVLIYKRPINKDNNQYKYIQLSNRPCKPYKLIHLSIAVPLTARDVNWGCLPKTVTRMDAGVEPPGRILRCVLGRCPQFMSRTG